MPCFLPHRLRWRRQQPITVLELRCRCLAPPLTAANSPDLWGCFSWVTLPAGDGSSGGRATVSTIVPNVKFERLRIRGPHAIANSGCKRQLLPQSAAGSTLHTRACRWKIYRAKMWFLISTDRDAVTVWSVPLPVCLLTAGLEGAMPVEAFSNLNVGAMWSMQMDTLWERGTVSLTDSDFVRQQQALRRQLETLQGVEQLHLQVAYT